MGVFPFNPAPLKFIIHRHFGPSLPPTFSELPLEPEAHSLNISVSVGIFDFAHSQLSFQISAGKSHTDLRIIAAAPESHGTSHFTCIIRCFSQAKRIGSMAWGLWGFFSWHH